MFERPAALHESIFDRLFEATEMAHLNSEQLYAYERSVRDYRDWKSMIETARRRDREEMREKMIEEAGIGKKKMILEMLRDV